MRRNDGVFDGNSRAITLLLKKVAIMAKDAMRGSMLRLLLVVLNWVQYLLIFNARLRNYFIRLGS